MSRRIPAVVTIDLVALFFMVSTGAGPVLAAQSTASVPDFNGSWARTTFALEQPVSGPGPLRNPQRRPNEDAAYRILRPAAEEQVRKRYEAMLAGAPMATPSSSCWPMVAPYIYRVQEMQFLQGKDQVTLIYMQDHEVRRVRLNAQHPGKVAPSWHGDSVGHYEGDTLVIDTVGMKIGPVSIIDQAGSPYSEALHVVERYRLISFEETKAARDRNIALNGAPGTQQAAGIDPSYRGKGLQVQFTVEDPNVFKTVWSGTATYSHADDLWVENVCAENTFEYYNNRDTAVPSANRPDF